MPVEKALTGEALYEASRAYQGIAVIARNLLAAQGPPWAELPWAGKDFWEAQADELNEARREA